jgi:Protein of unknown function (DUF3467)
MGFAIQTPAGPLFPWEIRNSLEQGQLRSRFPVISLVQIHSGKRFMANVPPNQPRIKLVSDPNYRENYANSVQVRVNVWDFFLVFGTMQQPAENEVEIRNFQGIYLSPQQAKALMTILQQNVTNYESTFGEIKLDPHMTAAGPIN